MLRGATAVTQSDYTSLQSDYSSPDRVIAASGRPDGEADADGKRNTPREVSAGLDIRGNAVRSAATAVLTAGALNP